ncbi:MAG: helicase-related protein [Nanobdellota archaeon]
MEIEQHYKSQVINLSLDTLKKDKQALIFANTKRGAEKSAEDVAKKIKDIEMEDLSEAILSAVSKPTKQCQRLAYCIKRGVAFHHSGLVAKQREVIEENFKSGRIKIIAATPTLAAGLDLPAYRVIMKDLKRFTQRGMQYIPVLEYKQMTGRAGRPKYDTVGEAISIASNDGEENEIKERYIDGEPEPIFSKLAVEPVLRTYLLSLISAKFLRKKEDVFSFFEKTFWAKQFEDIPKLRAIIEKTLHSLSEWGFIEKKSVEDDFVSADRIEDERYLATQTGRRVAELYIDPLTADHIIKSKEKEIFRILQMISDTLEMRPLLNVRNKDQEMVEQAIMEHDLFELEPTIYDPSHDDFMKSVKTALFFKRWIEECDEEFLLETFNIRPGEIKAKNDIADWLLYSAEELYRLKKRHDVLSEIRKLRTRIKYGVREELLPLLKLKNIGRARARSLYNKGIKTLGDVKKAEMSKLISTLGRKRAKDVKEQMGVKVSSGTLDDFS